MIVDQTEDDKDKNISVNVIIETARLLFWLSKEKEKIYTDIVLQEAVPLLF